jgi:hypothetical protein
MFLEGIQMYRPLASLISPSQSETIASAKTESGGRARLMHFRKKYAHHSFALPLESEAGTNDQILYFPASLE